MNTASTLAGAPDSNVPGLELEPATGRARVPAPRAIRPGNARRRPHARPCESRERGGRWRSIAWWLLGAMAVTGPALAAGSEPGMPNALPGEAPLAEPPAEPPNHPEEAPTPPSAPATTPAAAPAPVQGCVLSATVALAPDTALYDAADGGDLVGKFTGAELPLKVGPLTGSLKQGRVRVATAGGAPALRVEGWTEAGAIDTFAAHDLPLADRHVWITSSQPVSVVEARPTGLTVEYRVPGSLEQIARASVPCSAVALAPHAVSPVTVPSKARTYQMKTSTLELYDEPRGRVVFTLQMQPDARQVFWSSAARSGYVQILTRGGLTITAWAKATDLVPLRRGEAIMQDVPRVYGRQPRVLALENGPQPVAVSVELPIHARASGASRLIGVLEAGASVYPMERASGWVNVLPVGLGIMPNEGAGFWVSSAEVR